MSAITERGRRELYEQAEASWGEQAADVLMALFPPAGWAEVATKSDLSAVEERLLGEMKSENARLLRSMVLVNLTTVVAVFGLVFEVGHAVG